MRIDIRAAVRPVVSVNKIYKTGLKRSQFLYIIKWDVGQKFFDVHVFFYINKFT